LTFVGKKPSTDESRHGQLMGQLQRLTEEVARLRAAQGPSQA
jgi:hypothetical protein